MEATNITIRQAAAPPRAPETATQLALRDFECLPKPTLLLRPAGTIERANAAARELLADRHCLRIAYGRVVGFAGRSSEPFEETWARACTGCASRAVVTMFVGGAQRWHVEVTPMRIESAADSGLLLMVTVHPPVRPERGIVAMANRCNVNCTDSRLLAHVAAARTPARIGAALDVNVTAERTHQQLPYRKTGARQQPGFVRLAPTPSNSQAAAAAFE